MGELRSPTKTRTECVCVCVKEIERKQEVGGGVGSGIPAQWVVMVLLGVLKLIALKHYLVAM